MPDISMCSNKKCKDRKKCHRYTAMPDSYQSYIIWDVGKAPKDKKSCGNFWDNKEYEKNSPLA
jgi:hypothetical protein